MSGKKRARSSDSAPSSSTNQPDNYEYPAWRIPPDQGSRDPNRLSWGETREQQVERVMGERRDDARLGEVSSKIRAANIELEMHRRREQARWQVAPAREAQLQDGEQYTAEVLASMEDRRVLTTKLGISARPTRRTIFESTSRLSVRQNVGAFGPMGCIPAVNDPQSPKVNLQVKIAVQRAGTAVKRANWGLDGLCGPVKPVLRPRKAAGKVMEVMSGKATPQ